MNNPYQSPVDSKIELADNEFLIDFASCAHGLGQLGAVRKAKITLICISIGFLIAGFYSLFKPGFKPVAAGFLGGGMMAFYQSFSSKNKSYRRMYDEIKMENRVYSVRSEEGLFIYSSVRGDYRLPVDEIKKIALFDKIAFVVENNYLMFPVILRTEIIKNIIHSINDQVIARPLGKIA